MLTSDKITEHMEVIAIDGIHVGTVDHLEGNNRIKLTKSDSPDGRHHAIPLNWVDHVDEHVHLSISADEATRRWETLN